MEDTGEPPSPETMLAFRSRPSGDTTNGGSAAGSTPHLATHDITIRYHSTHIYIWRGFGTVTEVSSVPCITVYTAYSVGVYFMVNYFCQDGVHNIEVAGECHSHARLQVEHTLLTMQRFCGAFPFVMHMPAVMRGNPRNLDHI
eukprot:jgi/Tetstr1/462723/TSEL_007686.t1